MENFLFCFFFFFQGTSELREISRAINCWKFSEAFPPMIHLVIKKKKKISKYLKSRSILKKRNGNIGGGGGIMILFFFFAIKIAFT